ncbi:hypothetical protein Vau01_066480 [Virgisporangium aurantiacum]|uniref:Uncharacterized protein n=1 Tax=Virgisporangium aurantiacum TaxID=175570 RepID=A0A8J3Z8R1_9ACTN|nr:hypothetical protein Vau01_066480 [Virgisporangium aurantiacum]
MSAYGYRLGGPGAWNLHRVNVGDELRTGWYDERNPLHDFARAPRRQPLPVWAGRSAGRPMSKLPFAFMEALDVSPPGWTREIGAPPILSHHLPATPELRSLDRVAVAQYVLVVGDSLLDRDEEEAAYYRDDDSFVLDPALGLTGDPRLDWDGVLIAALTGLGLEPVGMPDWLWYRVAWTGE